MNNIKISQKLSSVIGVFIRLSGKDDMCEALCISVYCIHNEALHDILYDTIYIRTVYTYALMAILIHAVYNLNNISSEMQIFKLQTFSDWI